MNIKQFLKPDWRKIVITVIILLITIFYNTRTEPTPYPETIYYQGFPVEWWTYKAGGFIIGYELFSGKIILTGIIVDIIIWYFVSCFIVWIYDKYIKRVKKK